MGGMGFIENNKAACMLSVTISTHLLEAAKEAGIRAGMHCLAPAYARDMLALGFDLVTMGTDVRLFTAAYAGAMAELKT